jgi:hypothetical protein
VLGLHPAVAGFRSLRSELASPKEERPQIPAFVGLSDFIGKEKSSLRKNQKKYKKFSFFSAGILEIRQFFF